MDNWIFNVTGVGLRHLRRTLSLALALWYGKDDDKYEDSVYGYKVTEKGLVLSITIDTTTTPFPVPLDAKEVAPIAYQWLYYKQPDVEVEDKDRPIGWRVFCEYREDVPPVIYVANAIL